MVAPALLLPRRGLILPEPPRLRLPSLARFALVGVRRALLSRPAAAVVGGGGGLTSFATWDPANKAAGMTLSNGNLTATAGGGGSWCGVFSTMSKMSGKWYWEYTLSASGTMGHAVGIGNASQPLTMASIAGGAQTDSVYYSGDGNLYTVGSTGGATYTNSAVIGVKLDMDGHTWEVLKNNVSQYAGKATQSGANFAYVVIITTSTATVTANFGASAFTYAVPAGYNPGLGT